MAKLFSRKAVPFSIPTHRTIVFSFKNSLKKGPTVGTGNIGGHQQLLVGLGSGYEGSHRFRTDKAVLVLIKAGGYTKICIFFQKVNFTLLLTSKLK